MGKLPMAWRIATSWYVSLPVAAAIGVVIGYFVFFDLWPGKPKIGIIDIPFTVINDNTAFVIGAYLDFARENGDIKAVVIKMNSPGSVGAGGDLLYDETRKLREEKPVVVTARTWMTSGAYLWAMGSNYIYAKPATLTGNVGLRFFLPPLIPQPAENELAGEIISGPFKRLGFSRRQAFELTNQGKEAFAQTVFAERGDRLRLSPEELLEGRVYFGIEGLRLGLIDAIGGDTEAIEKAASLAGISDYELVDVNVEVSRIFNEKFMRIIEPLLPLFTSATDVTGLGEIRSFLPPLGGTSELDSPGDGISYIDMIRRFYLPSTSEEGQLELELPRIDYLYDGPLP